MWQPAVPAGWPLAEYLRCMAGTPDTRAPPFLCKCIEEGKSIIIEGCHLDPSLYLNEFGAAAVLEDAQVGQVDPGDPATTQR